MEKKIITQDGKEYLEVKEVIETKSKEELLALKTKLQKRLDDVNAELSLFSSWCSWKANRTAPSGSTYSRP